MKLYCTHCFSSEHSLSTCPNLPKFTHKPPPPDPNLKLPVYDPNHPTFEGRVQQLVRYCETPGSVFLEHWNAEQWFTPHKDQWLAILAKRHPDLKYPGPRRRQLIPGGLGEPPTPDTSRRRRGSPSKKPAHSQASAPDTAHRNTATAPAPPTPSRNSDTGTTVPSKPPRVTEKNTVTPVTEKRKRGPKKSGNALSAAEKQKAYRNRKKTPK